MKVLKIKKLVPEAVMPKYATDGSAGMDLTAITHDIDDIPSRNGLVNGAHCFKHIYGTGLAFEIPSGHVGLIFPRSSIHKTGMTLTNCVGVIDSDYRGEVKFVFRLRPDEEAYSVGDRVGQLVIVELPKIQIEETTEISDTERGVGGFGSTGR